MVILSIHIIIVYKNDLLLYFDDMMIDLMKWYIKKIYL